MEERRAEVSSRFGISSSSQIEELSAKLDALSVSLKKTRTR